MSEDLEQKLRTIDALFITLAKDGFYCIKDPIYSASGSRDGDRDLNLVQLKATRDTETRLYRVENYQFMLNEALGIQEDEENQKIHNKYNQKTTFIDSQIQVSRMMLGMASQLEVLELEKGCFREEEIQERIPHQYLYIMDVPASELEIFKSYCKNIIANAEMNSRVHPEKNKHLHIYVNEVKIR
jgi:hypothetical protein